jgi:integrase
MSRIQNGYLYEASGAFFVRYYARKIIDGTVQRVQSSHRLCEKNDKYYALNAKAVKLLRNEFMATVNQQRPSSQQQDIGIVTFWEQHYLPYCEEVLPLTGEPRKKASTVRGYKQIWKQHLEAHFSGMTLQEYDPAMGTRFLQTLTATQGKVTLKHIKALGSSLFGYACQEEIVKFNPFLGVKLPDDAIESKPTKHYTMEQAEDMISALVGHVDAQLVLALSCFLGLRPGETAALRWEDFDSESIHIRRSVVCGIVGTPKTLESGASLPLIDQVRVPLELWRMKSGNPSSGWVFSSRNDTPIDLHNLINRVIKPVLKEAGINYFSGLYAGRRGACTAVVEATGGNYAVARALLRHKSMALTLSTYKKKITPAAFKAGMKLFQNTITPS